MAVTSAADSSANFARILARPVKPACGAAGIALAVRRVARRTTPSRGAAPDPLPSRGTHRSVPAARAGRAHRARRQRVSARLSRVLPRRQLGSSVRQDQHVRPGRFARPPPSTRGDSAGAGNYASPDRYRLIKLSEIVVAPRPPWGWAGTSQTPLAKPVRCGENRMHGFTRRAARNAPRHRASVRPDGQRAAR